MILLVVGWTIGWFWLRGEAVQRMEAGVEQLRKDGYDVAWKERDIGGFPFRLDVTLKGARIAEPSGWAVSTDEIKAEAWIYKLDHWVAVLPKGLTISRPEGGPVIVGARALRASLAGFDQRPPRLSIEGADLTFTTPPGTKPYPIETAEGLQLHLRQGPNDQGGILFRLDKAKLRLTGLPARVAQGKPVTLTWDLVLARMAAFDGSSWREAAMNWDRAGGVVTVREASIRGGDALLIAEGGPLRVGDDGRLEGELKAKLKDADSGIQALGGTVEMSGGKAMLGPLEIGPSPRVF